MSALIPRALVASSFAALLALGLAGCGPTPPASPEIAAMLDEAARFPAAGDDLTMYIGERFADIERAMAVNQRNAQAEAAPTF